jgi:hypothetical protein
MEIEILPFDIELELLSAMQVGGSNNLDVLLEIAKRYPDCVFTRKDDAVRFSAATVKSGIEMGIDPR